MSLKNKTRKYRQQLASKSKLYIFLIEITTKQEACLLTRQLIASAFGIKSVWKMTQKLESETEE